MTLRVRFTFNFFQFHNIIYCLPSLKYLIITVTTNATPRILVIIVIKEMSPKGDADVIIQMKGNIARGL